MTDPARVVGLDLSLTSTGIATAEGERNIFPKAKATGVDRLIYLRDALLECLRPIPAPLIVVEGYAFARKGSHAHSIGEWGGVARVALTEAGCLLAEAPPTNRAKMATGKGNSGKSDVVSHVTKITGRVWDGKGNEDRCDAFVLRQMGLSRLGLSEYAWSKDRLAALDGVDWAGWEDTP